MAPNPRGDIGFLRRVLMVAAVLALALLAWYLVDVLLLVFGAILVAVLLRALANPIARRTPLSDAWALIPATLGIVVVVALAAWLLGAEVRAQVTELAERLPDAWRSFEERLGATDLGERIVSRAHDAAPGAGSVVSGLAGVVTSFVSGLADFLLIVFGGLYLAVQPGLYRRGILLLFPAEGSRERIAGTLDASGQALRLWLLGQLVSMTFLFVLTGLGLWAIGVPAALALAMLAGLAQFVPLLGPIVAAVPALLIALSEGWQIAVWTLMLYVAIQQVESNIITPLVQRQAVSLPPAVTLFAVVAFGLLFGPLGILFATPLAVVAMVAIKRLWVRDALGEPTDLAGEQ
ncbi:MAG TPA: AI-2E family transporter [Geminicoccaceae bacterium]